MHSSNPTRWKKKNRALHHSNSSTQRAVMNDDVNFEFAYNSRAFSDRILKIEVADEATSKDLDSQGDQIPDLKRKRCEEMTNDNDELGSSSNDLDSRGDQIPDMKRKRCEETTNYDSELGSAAAAADASETILRVESVHVNSAILAAMSKFFYKLFSNGMQESDQQHVTVRVNPSEETALMELIRFMYSGKLSSISPPFVLDVITIADKFEVPTCTNHCIQQAMALPMTKESALLYLDLPPALSMVSAVEPLVNAAEEFLGSKYKKITAVSKDELLTLSLTAMEAILRREDLEIQHEDMVYDILVEWARARYPKPDELRDVFNHRLAPLVRFAHMSYGRLGQLLASADLNGGHASKLIADAIIFKAESPLRQRELQAADGWLAERAYTRIPIKMIEFESQFPHCIIYMDLKKDRLAEVFPSGGIRTHEICLGGERLYLSGNCKQEPNGTQCFGFYLYSVQDGGGEKLTVAYEFAAWWKSLGMFIFKKKGVFNRNVSDTLAAKLLAAADTYKLERLRVMCESYLCKDISVNTVASTLGLADQYHAMELKSACLKFAAENLAAVMRSTGFEYLKENCPSLQSELLKIIAGCEEECSSGGKSRSVWAQLSDGGDSNGRRVRPRT